MQPTGQDPTSRIEDELFAALDRLVRGKPKNADLKRKIAQGKRCITFASVAREAGRSRTLIAHKNCAYPKVRQRIKELTGALTAKPLFGKETVLRLRQEKRDLLAKLKAALSEAADHFIARVEAERDRTRWKSAYEALQSEPPQGNIVRLVPRRHDELDNEE